MESAASVNNPRESETLDHPSRFAVGGKVGLNVATFGGADADREGVESLYSLGIVVDVLGRLNLSNHWGIQSELAFTTKGSGSRVEGTKRPPFNYSYAEFALFAYAQWGLPSLHDRISIHGVLGPSTGYLLQAKRDEEDFTDSADRLDVGLHAGAGVTIELPYGNLLIESRYYYGLLGIGGDSGLELSHRTFSFLLGYEVPLPPARSRQPDAPPDTEAPSPVGAR